MIHRQNAAGYWYVVGALDPIEIAWKAVNPRHPFPDRLRPRLGGKGA